MERIAAIKSQTLIGAVKTLVPVLVLVLNAFGVTVLPEDANSFIEHATAIIVAVAGVWGIWDVVRGRLKPEVRPIGGVFTNGTGNGR